MLVAGASAADTSAGGGALSFAVPGSPLWIYWYLGSANMLLAGAGVSDHSVTVGALTFSVYVSPLWAGWSSGSA